MGKHLVNIVIYLAIWKSCQWLLSQMLNETKIKPPLKNFIAWGGGLLIAVLTFLTVTLWWDI